MSNSVVKVTELPTNEGLFVLKGKDGVIMPDRETLEKYLSGRKQETEINLICINEAYGNNIEATMEPLIYDPNNTEDMLEEIVPSEMDENEKSLQQNLLYFRLDHDYTLLESPKQTSPEHLEETDELAQTLSILEGCSVASPPPLVQRQQEPVSKPVVNIVKQQPTLLHMQQATKAKVKRVVEDKKSATELTSKQQSTKSISRKSPKQTQLDSQGKSDEESADDEDFTLESEESDDEDDENDSDFELDDSTKVKLSKRTRGRRKRDGTALVEDKKQKAGRIHKIQAKSLTKQVTSPVEKELEQIKSVEKPPEAASEQRTPEKKPIKKEKKVPKPLPDDFALFSTPDIIRRVGGKHETSTSTPTTPIVDSSINTPKPAKITAEARTKSFSERSSIEGKVKRPSTDSKLLPNEKVNIKPKTNIEDKNKDRRMSLDTKSSHPADRRLSLNLDSKKTSNQGNLAKPLVKTSSAQFINRNDQVIIQSVDESAGSSSSENISGQMDAMPSVEDIRAMIQNEDTKTYSNSLVIPDPVPNGQPQQANVDQNSINLEGSGLDIDPLLENINSDLISEDILYQVAQSLADNTELQNAIDKSLNDGNLVLDPNVQQAIAQTQNVGSHLETHQKNINTPKASIVPNTSKGTQIVRPDGRVVIIPPIERPATRSRNRKQQQSPEVSKATPKVVHKPLDEEHVSGNELDSSDAEAEQEEEEEEEEDDRSDDDPDKLWCICNQPHNNRFMICCDQCEEWYHGKCVNVTKAMGQLMEQEGREWICVYCKVSKNKVNALCHHFLLLHLSSPSKLSYPPKHRGYCYHEIVGDHRQINTPKASIVPNTSKGTQIVRPDGRVVIIPPIERPATRSRNRKQQQSPEVSKATPKVVHKPLDEEHVSGNELDSSDAEAEQEEEEEEEEDDRSDDDPDKLWCICNQPHNNRFMICCDQCEEWYHGKCVNVTKAMGQLMEQEGREWICVYCKDPTLKRPAAAARRIRKASKASTDSGKSQNKSTSSLTESSGKSSSSSDCIVCGKPSRSNSIFCSDQCILKQAQTVERVVVFERSTGKILSGSNAPSAANLEKWLKEHPGFEVVRSTSKPMPNKNLSQSKLKLVRNVSNEGVSLAIQRRGVNIGLLNHSPKAQQNQQQFTISQRNRNVVKTIPHFKIVRKQKPLVESRTKLIQPPPMTVITTPTRGRPPQIIQKVQTNVTPKQSINNSIPSTSTSTPIVKERPKIQKTLKPKLPDDQTSLAPPPKQSENIRENVKKTLFEQLTNRLKMVNDIKLEPDEVCGRKQETEINLICINEAYGNNIEATMEPLIYDPNNTEDMLEESEQILEDNRPKGGIDSTEVIATLNSDNVATSDSPDSKASKDKDKKGSKYVKYEKGRERDRERRNRSQEKSDSRERKKEEKSLKDYKRRSKSRSRSRSRDRTSRYIEKKKSNRDHERHHRSSHKSSRHKKEPSTTEKLDKKSKEILEQLVDKQIVPPLEDRLWKHVPQEDITTPAIAESDSDHEPSSTVTIPTPPRTTDVEESPSVPPVYTEKTITEKPEKKTVVAAKTPSPPSSNEDRSMSPPPKTTAEYLWKGTINMVDVAQISITAHEVSGDCAGLGEELPPALDVVGRISPETVWEYIGKMKCSNSKAISLIRLNATNMEEKMPYIALYSYLSSRNRLGVIKSLNKAVKDFYILPLASQKPIPQALLPINGPGFEESRPALLLGIIVRDKRKRPIFDQLPSVSKRTKIEVSVIITPPVSTTPVTATARSYTPPPPLIRDPRIKTAPQTASVPSPETPKDTTDDMDEPYSPEDSDPDTVISPPASVSAPTLDTGTLLPAIKSSPYVEVPPTVQPFEPFSSKFDSIPGLEETSVASVLPASSQELQKKMAELDQKIAMQKAEIDNMSQSIVSTAAADIGSSSLANIALPSNLQQILDSIKGIGASSTSTDNNTATSVKGTSSNKSDLTMPLLLPKISSRSAPPAPSITAIATSKKDLISSSSTIPLNLPKPKIKPTTISSSLLDKTPVLKSEIDKEKPSGVLSSLSEEDLIRKAAEMLGEKKEDTIPKMSKMGLPPEPYTPTKPGYQTTSRAPPPYASGPVMYTTPPPMPNLSVPPPNILPPSNIQPSNVIPSIKRLKVDDQPPVPGLEDEM
ncbi:uncharacterized protein LOC108740585 [Agrilus planipennis]|uniref:Uncharacterized protein LOC108740585 n=1 Tax=Agrilus planipennis TaxID=224129 RepID=A0A7F5R667_AGRPL|nr:uncharacterized protein LOC108740585 [Agrilus planipennis]